MTKFLDGPAKDKMLMLKRSPKFLRVVQKVGNQEFDALDQLDDHPIATETLFAYVQSKYLGTCHINRGRNGSGFYPIAEYKFVTEQPTDEVMRDEYSWAQWCKSKA